MKQYELNEWTNVVLNRTACDHVATSNAINTKYSAFDQIRIINTLKKCIDVPRHHLRNRPKMFIFGAGGTTSWFLPKVLKVFNDIFNKRPDLRYPFQIVLVDGDVV